MTRMTLKLGVQRNKSDVLKTGPKQWHAKFLKTELEAIRLACKLLSYVSEHATRKNASLQGIKPPRSLGRWVEEAEKIEYQAKAMLQSHLTKAMLESHLKSVSPSPKVELLSMYKKIVDHLKKSPFELVLIYDGPANLTVITPSSIMEVIAEYSSVGKKKMFDLHITKFETKATSSVVGGISPAQKRKAEDSMKAAQLPEELHGEEAGFINTPYIGESVPVIKVEPKLEIPESEEVPSKERGANVGWKRRSDRDKLEPVSELFPGSESSKAISSVVGGISPEHKRQAEGSMKAAQLPEQLQLKDADVGTTSLIGELVSDEPKSRISEIEEVPPKERRAKVAEWMRRSAEDKLETESELFPGSESTTLHEKLMPTVGITQTEVMPEQRNEAKTTDVLGFKEFTDEGLQSFPRTQILGTSETECFASEIERGLQLNAESTLSMITSIKGFNLQLVIFHGGHSAKLHDAIKDPVFLLREDDYLAFVRTDEKIGRPPKPESGEGEISERYGSSSSLLERPERPNILQKAGKGLTKPPPEEEWGQFSVIDLSGNEFSSLPEKPDCPNLLFLFLQSNRCLEMISDSFFHYMCSLNVVDLSRTGIRSLPPSLFECTGLQALLLRDCKNLDELPPEVGNLGFIEVLDLCGTEVYNLPVEIAKLTHLKRLHVSFYGPADQREYRNLPRELISSDVILKILALQSLRIHVDPADSRWNNNANALTHYVSRLSNLTHLQFYFPEVEFLRIFIQNSVSWNERRLGKFKFVVGQDIKRIVSRVPDYIESEYDNHDRCLRFVNGVEIPEEVAGVLERVTAFYLDHHCEIKNLSEFGIIKFNELEFCVVRECPQIVEIIDSKERTDSLLPCLQHLSMHYLWKLERLWKGPMPHGSLGRLKILSVHTCHKLETVLTWSMLHCLSNMEELIVEDCASLKKIIEMEEQEVSAGAILPHLKKMKLHYLPQLAILWDGFCPTLEQVSIYGCLKLKKSQYFNLTTTEIEA